MTTQIWNVATVAGEEWQHSGDPEQVIFARVSGPDAAPHLLPADSNVSRLDLESFSVKTMKNNGDWADLVTAPKGGATLYVTDRRVIAVKRDIDLGPSVAVRSLDWAIPGAVLMRDLAKGVSRRMGATVKHHLAAQIDYQSLLMVRYTKGKRSYQGGTGLQLTAYLGEPEPNSTTALWVDMHRDTDTRSVAEDLCRRALQAQLSRTLEPLTPAEREKVAEAQFEPSGHGSALTLHGFLPLQKYKELVERRA